MKIMWIGLILFAAALSGCGNKGANDGVAAAPNDNAVIQHNAAECPAWSGDFVNSANRNERKSLRVNGRGTPRPLLIDQDGRGQETYVLSGKFQRMDNNNLYSASCSAGRIIVEHGYASFEGGQFKANRTAITTYSQNADGSILVSRRHMLDSSYNWDRTYVVFRMGPPKPPGHRPGPPRRGLR